MIELKGVTKNYGLKSLGLSNVDLKINPGEVVGILGQNGSGKTTLLKSIMGLCALNRGEGLIDGKDPKSQYERLSYITEEGSFFPAMTPLEYGDFLSEFFSKFDKPQYLKLLRFFEIDERQKIKTMSRGQKAKVETAAGFSRGADIILMDEPFLGKDMVTRRDFLKLMNASLRTHETILVATHLIDEIEYLLDRVVILKFGRIVRDFYMDELREQGISLEDKLLEAGGYTADRYQKWMDEI